MTGLMRLGGKPISTSRRLLFEKSPPEESNLMPSTQLLRMKLEVSCRERGAKFYLHM